MTDQDPRHGTENGYGNLGCRCAACREAWRVACTARSHRMGRRKPREEAMALRRAMTEERNPHGTIRRYWNGCRCRKCKNAGATYKQGRRARGAA